MPSLLFFSEHAGCALVFGALIGIERELRSSTTGGLRTNTLVSTGAALFVLIETMLGATDSRVAAQIVSGIGFIGGGAILREGLTIRGVNTAATLWCSAAVGALCGSGLVAEAALGTAGILAANVLLRPVSYRLSGRTKLRENVETHYELQFTGRALDESHLRKCVVRAVKNASLLVRSLRTEPSADPTSITIKATVVSETKSDAAMEALVEQLSAEKHVTAVAWEVASQPSETHE